MVISRQWMIDDLTERHTTGSDLFAAAECRRALFFVQPRY
jgi:hypothetical protein